MVYSNLRLAKRVLTAILASLVFCTSPIAAPLTSADLGDIARLETYLNSIRSLKARFLQTDPDGSSKEGKAWIERPGKMRFEYDPPTPLLLIVGYGVGFLIDKKLQQTNNFPVFSSPLSIFLGDIVKLSDSVTVDGIERLPGQIQVTVHQSASPRDGQLKLVFADHPLSLRQWAVIDNQRRETRVSLFNIELGGKFDPKLFLNSSPDQNSNGGNQPLR